MRGIFALISVGLIAIGCGGEETSGTGGGAGSGGSSTATSGGGQGGTTSNTGGAGGMSGTGGMGGMNGAGGAGGMNGAGGAGGAGGMSGLPFGAACMDNTQCASGLCFNFNAKGQHCSKSCMVDGDCPPGSTGCNNMGICKIP